MLSLPVIRLSVAWLGFVQKPSAVSRSVESPGKQGPNPMQQSQSTNIEGRGLSPPT